MSVDIVRAERHHAWLIATLMADADKAELQAMGFVHPVSGILHAMDGALIVDTAMVSGVPAAMWGVNPDALIGHRAMLWFLGTPTVQKKARDLLKLSKYFTDKAQQRYSVLYCYVDSRHDKAVRWLLWLGFSPANTFDINGVAFITMERKRT